MESEIKKPVFARVTVQAPTKSDQSFKSENRREFLKLVYPNDVMLILPVNIDPDLLRKYIHAID